MGSYILVFGLGMLFMYAITYLLTHPEMRVALFARLHSFAGETYAEITKKMNT